VAVGAGPHAAASSAKRTAKLANLPELWPNIAHSG